MTNKKKVKISVVIPTCDRPDLLKQAIVSIENQTYKPEEIIVVDNGTIPVKIKHTDYRLPIKYIRGFPKFGVAQARNIGAIYAGCDYVAFLDDDDLWEEEYLKNVATIVSKRAPEIILGSLKDFKTGEIIESKSKEIVDRNAFIKELLVRNPGAGGSNTIVRKDVLLESKGYDPYLITGEDKALILDLLLSEKNILIERSLNSHILYRQDFSMERLTDIKKRIKGKRRFYVKYHKYMSSSLKLKVLIQLFYLFCLRLKEKTIGSK